MEGTGRIVYSIPLLLLAGINHWQHIAVVCKKAFIDVIGCLVPFHIANCKSSEREFTGSLHWLPIQDVGLKTAEVSMMCWCLVQWCS